MRTSIKILLVSLFLFSCEAEEKGLSALSETGKNILKIRKASNEAIISGDLEAIASFWEKDILISTGAGTLLAGSEEVKTYLSTVFVKTPDIVFVRMTKDIQENLETQMAWEEGEWKGFRKSNPNEILASGKYAAAWAKTGEDWKIKSQLFVGL
ncbi:MAG: DUF4440 domain-containing protein [Bacteroidota bacterium]